VLQKQNNIVIYFDAEKCTLDMADLVQKYNNRIKFSTGITPYITYKIQKQGNIMQEIEEILS